jgi:hypothetical protein
MPDGISADLVASRTILGPMLTLMSKHILFRHSAAGSVSDLQAFFESSFRYAKHVNRVPLLRGMQFGYMIIPCLAVGSPSPDLIAYVTGQPRQHWALFEFPVVYDLSSHQTYYFRETAAWGRFLFPQMRSIVENHISCNETKCRA